MRKSRKEDNTTSVGNMTAQDHYSLRWNNHQNHILRAFDALLQTKTLVDVTLVCAETSIRAHKMVLSACSPFFQRVFSETPCKHPVIVLKDFRGWVVQAIVDFMYRGEISVPQERLQTLIQAGESLQVRGLVENTTVPANTPTPAASPDDFGIMDTSMLASDLERCSNYDDGDTPPTMVDSSSKLILPSHVFPSDTNQSGPISNPDLCTSPMPRRKQARPRRRSGECAPHDLSKPSSPTPDDMEVKSESEKPEREDRSKCDDDGDDNDDDDDQNEEIRPPSSMDCEEVIPENETISRVVDNSEGPEDLCTKKDCEDSTQNDNGPNSNNNNNSTSSNNLNNNNNINSNNNNNSSNNHSNNNNNNNDINSNNNNNNNNNRIVLSLKDFRHISKPQTSDLRSPTLFPPHHLNIRGSGSGGGGDNQSMKSESMEGRGEIESPFHMEQMDLSMAAAAAAAAQHHHHQQHMSANNIMAMSNAHQSHGHDRLDDVQNRMSKEFTPSSPMSLPSHFNPPDGPPHPPSPLPFPGMSSALALTPQNMFGFDSPLGLFPPGMDPGKLYNPLMEMSDPRGLPNEHPPFIKKKSKYLPRPKGQHSAPRGGPPRSWTNAELTEALQHVWNKKMTTSQASRIFGIPYNSLLMYVRGKYGKSLKLEQLRKDCISGPPIELITMGLSKNADRNKDLHLKDLDVPIPRSSSSEPDLLSSPNPLFNPFPPGFYPDFPGGFPGLPLSMLNLLPPERHQPSGGMHMNLDEDCKSDRSKQSLEDDFSQPLALARDERRELLQQNGQD